MSNLAAKTISVIIIIFLALFAFLSVFTVNAQQTVARYINKYWDVIYHPDGHQTTVRRIYGPDDLLLATIAPDEGAIAIEAVQSAGMEGMEGEASIGSSAPTIHYIHADHLTSSSVVSKSNGTLEELTDYYPYGKIKLDQTSSFKEKRKFTGHHFDEESDLTYAKARYYDQDIGRFFSQDPAFQVVGNSQQLKEKTGLELEQYLADPQGMNSYSYVKNNPLKYVDPSGEWFQEFATGQQSWNSFQLELGQAANQLSNDSAVWNAAISNPIAGGAVVGIGSGAAAYGASAGLTALSLEYLAGAGTQIINNLNKLETLPQRTHAQQRLAELSQVTGKSINQILTEVSRSGKSYIDFRPGNVGNINVLLQRSVDSMTRITTDPQITRIISAGTIGTNNVANNVARGGLQPLGGVLNQLGNTISQLSKFIKK